MDDQLQVIQNPEQTYTTIRQSIVQAQHTMAAAVNSAMVTAYWDIGEQIYKACGENDRAGYGKGLLRFLADNLTSELGKGFDESNLRKMRQFYCVTNSIRDTLCPELSWSRYCILMRIADEKERAFYLHGVFASWSGRFIPCTISGCFPARRRLLFPRRFKPPNRSRNMRKSSKIPM